MILGISILIWLAAVALYVLAVYFGTETFKRIIKLDPWCLSVIIGLILFLIFGLADSRFLKLEIFFIFIVLHGVTNAAYKFTALKKILRAALDRLWPATIPVDRGGNFVR